MVAGAFVNHRERFFPVPCTNNFNFNFNFNIKFSSQSKIKSRPEFKRPESIFHVNIKIEFEFKLNAEFGFGLKRQFKLSKYLLKCRLKRELLFELERKLEFQGGLEVVCLRVNHRSNLSFKFESGSQEYHRQKWRLFHGRECSLKLKLATTEVPVGLILNCAVVRWNGYAEIELCNYISDETAMEVDGRAETGPSIEISPMDATGKSSAAGQEGHHPEAGFESGRKGFNVVNM